MFRRVKFALPALAVLVFSSAAWGQTPTPRGPITGGVLNGKAVSKPAPAYPPVARAARASGTVVVRIVVDEEGKVTEAEAVSGHPLLRQAAVQAAKHARFSPTFLSGQPVKVTGNITYNFVLAASAGLDRRGRLVSLFNLADNAGQCEIVTHSGVIDSLRYDDEGTGKIVGLELREDDGGVVTIRIGGRLYTDLSPEETAKLPDLLAPGLSVRVGARDCRAADRGLIAEDIHAVGPGGGDEVSRR
jgi:TonB family protein